MEKAKQLLELLINNNMRICCAESCTGGMLSSKLIDVPCASSAVDMGFVTYANEAKIKLLSVSADTISECGVVSEAVAGQMASGAAKVSGAQVGVGISGIAGPTGATPNKPIGTVCFGFCINGEQITYTEHFGDVGRNRVREKSCDFAINKLIELLERTL